MILIYQQLKRDGGETPEIFSWKTECKRKRRHKN
jgi:hypothetical protein